MWIILWFLQSFLNALWMVLTKKILEKKEVWNNIQTFFSRFNHIIIILLLLMVPFLNLNIEVTKEALNFKNISLFLIWTIFLYVTYPLRRIAYANEKVSVLQPFSMLFQVFPIIFWFIFIASERINIITFIIALIASIVVILSSLDIKTLKINKYSLMVLLSSIIKSWTLFITIYFITILTPETLYLIESIAIIIISLILMFIKKEFWQFKLIKKDYFKLLNITNAIVVFSILIVLNMYLWLWVIMTSLFSLLYLAFVYIFWYIILKEIPNKKDILIAVFVVICVILGLYFKQ